MVSRPPGRPTILDDEIAKVICTALAAGQSKEAAAALAGVSARTIKHWFAKGRKDEAREPYASFVRRAELAEAGVERFCLEELLDKSKDWPWQRYAWLLERKWPNRWGLRKPRDERGDDGGSQVTVHVVPGEAATSEIASLRAEIDRLRSQLGDGGRSAA